MSAERLYDIDIPGGKMLAYLDVEGALKRINEVGPNTPNPDGELAKKLFPHLAASKKPMDVMALYEQTRTIQLWRKQWTDRFIGILEKSNEVVDIYKNAYEQNLETRRKAEEAFLKECDKGNAEIADLKTQLSQALARSGAFATQDKHDLEAAREHIRQLKAQLEGLQATLERQSEVIRAKEAELETHRAKAREAASHGRTVLERLRDRFPSPTPFFAAIIEEARATVENL